MSLLAADYGDSSSSDDEVEVPKQVVQVEPKKSVELPGVDDIFEETKAPLFLKKKNTQDVATFDIDEDTLAELPPPPVERNVESDDESTNTSSSSINTIYQFPGINEAEEHIPRNTKHLPRQRGTNTKRKVNTTSDKVTGKERVKQQRLKGQSGIGSDFRSWKSEGEMKMRQEFD